MAKRDPLPKTGLSRAERKAKAKAKATAVAAVATKRAQKDAAIKREIARMKRHDNELLQLELMAKSGDPNYERAKRRFSSRWP